MVFRALGFVSDRSILELIVHCGPLLASILWNLQIKYTQRKLLRRVNDGGINGCDFDLRFLFDNGDVISKRWQPKHIFKRLVLYDKYLIKKC